MLQHTVNIMVEVEVTSAVLSYRLLVLLSSSLFTLDGLPWTDYPGRTTLDGLPWIPKERSLRSLVILV